MSCQPGSSRGRCSRNGRRTTNRRSRRRQRTVGGSRPAVPYARRLRVWWKRAAQRVRERARERQRNAAQRPERPAARTPRTKGVSHGPTPAVAASAQAFTTSHGRQMKCSKVCGKSAGAVRCRRAPGRKRTQVGMPDAAVRPGG